MNNNEKRIYRRAVTEVNVVNKRHGYSRRYLFNLNIFFLFFTHTEKVNFSINLAFIHMSTDLYI